MLCLVGVMGLFGLCYEGISGSVGVGFQGDEGWWKDFSLVVRLIFVIL